MAAEFLICFATGIAAIHLLLGKLWSVYPLVLQWPPFKSVLQVFERASIATFVSASLMELATGLLNTSKWYARTIPFRQTHYWLAWVIIGSLALHIAVKLPINARHWSRKVPEVEEKAPQGLEAGQRTGFRRSAFLATITASKALVADRTLPSSVMCCWLEPIGVVVRRSDEGPAGRSRAPADSILQVTSMEKSGNYRLMTMPAASIRDARPSLPWSTRERRRV
ncbi:hypothetical protein AAGW05_16430 [Arthrobacter sp. LAPM80]|uniref:hypothetical protein n=1 Tax=Arthrobacter sp. LAPM80 TaxID=3141788 RepID=UPI00398A5D9B